MKWISKKAAVIDETSRPQSGEKKNRYAEKRKDSLLRRRLNGVDRDKMQAFIACSWLSRKAAAELLGMKVTRLRSIIYDGTRLRDSERVIIDAKLAEAGIEIKERKISFE